jgi:hypothetical protein
MDDATATAQLRQHGQTLLHLARALQVHSVGDRWQGPARRACEAQLEELALTIVTAARRADVLGHHLNTPDVRASLR